jgi:hypothetical protein
MHFITSKQIIPVDRHQCAPPWVTRRQPRSIVLHSCMCKGVMFVFHKIHPEKTCRPPPLRTVTCTTMGHPPTTMHRYAPGSDFFFGSGQLQWAGPCSDSIVLHVCMCKGMVFVFHNIHPDDLCRRPSLRTTVGHPPTNKHRYAPDSGSTVLHVCMCKV